MQNTFYKKKTDNSLYFYPPCKKGINRRRVVYYKMMSILFTMFPLLAQSIVNSPKLCVNCKFFKKDFFSTTEFGKCSLFPLEKGIDKYLVNGKIKNEPTDYTYCSIARNRDSMCGPEGRFFVRKGTPPGVSMAVRPGSPPGGPGVIRRALQTH